MLSDEIGRELHDRATRGKTLTKDEYKLLDKWYNSQDSAEIESLNSNSALETEHILQRQINSILLKIEATSEQIHKLTNENSLLRKHIADINRKLSEKMMAHTI